MQNLERYQKELQAQREQERQRLAIAEDRLKSCMLFVMRTAYWQMYLYDLQTHDSEFFLHYASDHNKDKFDEVWQRWKP
jgi:hypothetical protein